MNRIQSGFPSIQGGIAVVGTEGSQEKMDPALICPVVVKTLFDRSIAVRLAHGELEQPGENGGFGRYIRALQL